MNDEIGWVHCLLPLWTTIERWRLGSIDVGAGGGRELFGGGRQEYTWVITGFIGTGSFEEAWLIVVVILYTKISSFSPLTIINFVTWERMEWFQKVKYQKTPNNEPTQESNNDTLSINENTPKRHFRDLGSSLNISGRTSRIKQVQPKKSGSTGNKEWEWNKIEWGVALAKTDKGIRLIKKQAVETTSAQNCLGTFIWKGGL